MMTRIGSSRNDRRNTLGINDTNSPSPLLSSSTNDKESMLMKNMKMGIETIPNYLTKRNQSFQQMIHDVR